MLFLRATLQAFSNPNVALTALEIASLALLPVSTVLLALRLVELHPKPGRTQRNYDMSRKDGERGSGAPGKTDAENDSLR